MEEKQHINHIPGSLKASVEAGLPNSLKEFIKLVLKLLKNRSGFL